MTARIVAIVSVCLLAVPGHAQDKSAPDDKVAILLDLQTILQPAPPDPSRRPDDEFMRSRSVHTVPFGTMYVGLCQRSVLTVNYSIEPGPAPTYRPYVPTPYSVSATSQFHVTPAFVPPKTGSPGPRNPDCRAVDTLDSVWFDSVDAGTAAYGYDGLTRAVAAIRAGTGNIRRCIQKGKVSEDCARIAAHKYPEDIEHIASCPAVTPNDCYTINLEGGEQVVIRQQYRSGKPNEIVAVEYIPPDIII